MLTAIVPVSPGERVSGRDEGDTAASEMAKSGVELVCPAAFVVMEKEPWCAASP